MSKFDERIVSDRFIAVLDELIHVGHVINDTDFAKRINISKQGLSSIRAGRRKITISLIIKTMEKFSANPYYILRGVGSKILTPEMKEIIENDAIGTSGENAKTIANLEKLLKSKNETIAIQEELIKVLREKGK